METLANKVASYLGKSLNKDDEQINVMAYGFVALFQMIAIFLLSLLFGILFDFLLETMVVFFSVGFLRRLIGGYHSSKLYSCLIISVFCIILFSSVTRYLIIPFAPLWTISLAIVAIYIFAFILTYKLAPIDNPNKRIRTEKKRLRLRRNSFIVLFIFFIVSVAFLYLQYTYRGVYSRIIVSLSISVLWQVSMLTKAGKNLISGIDSILKFC